VGLVCRGVWYAGFVNFFTEGLPRVWWNEVGGGDVEGICVCVFHSLSERVRETKVKIQLSR
jgi:hypothetical protein